MENGMNNFEIEGTLERIKMIKRGAPLSTLWPSDIDTILNALEKQIYKKPVYEADGYDSNGELIYDTWICPNCEKRYEVDYDSYDCCPKCGQAIDWNEEEEE